MSDQMRFKGKVASPGMALGAASVLPGMEEALPRTRAADSEAQIERVQRALAEGRRQIDVLLKRTNLVQELREIFEAQQLLLDDPMLREEVERRIREEGINGEWALARAVARFKSVMAERADPFFQERLLDLDDAVQRVIANMLGVPDGDLRAPFVRDLPENSILIGEELPPSLMLRLGTNVTGVALERGGLTGHTAVIARNRGLPALVGLGGVARAIGAGQTVLLDACDGELVLAPGREDREKFESYRTSTNLPAARLPRSPLAFGAGEELRVLANMDRREDCFDPRAACVSGTGLFRTEFLYMRDPELLDSLEAQAEAYHEILTAMNGRRTVFRLLDIGDDKSVFALGGFSNDARGPEGFIGDRRGISFLLEHRALLESQLQAILRAAARVRGPVDARIMLPMVRTVEEVRAFQEALARVEGELGRAGFAVPPVPVGLMIETPAAALMADVFSRHGAFLSIGSNDLAHLTMPLEGRGESENETAFFEPAVLRMIEQTVARATVPLSLCGEIAGIPELLPVLVGLGLREFSVALPALARCLPALEALQGDDCRALAARALQAETAEAVRALVTGG